MSLLLWCLAVILVIGGLVGIVLPALPGTILILAGLVLAAWADGFARVGPGMLVLIGVIGVASYGVDFVAASAEQLPFRTSAFDATLMISVLGEVPHPEAAVGELARVLKPGGTASFSETFNDPDYVRLPVLSEMCGTAGLRAASWRRQLLGYILRVRRD